MISPLSTLSFRNRIETLYLEVLVLLPISLMLQSSITIITTPILTNLQFCPALSQFCMRGRACQDEGLNDSRRSDEPLAARPSSACFLGQPQVYVVAVLALVS